MSAPFESYGKVKYSCHNDCKFGGCPGHELELRDEKHSDSIVVLIDGEDVHWFDPKMFSAMVKLYESEKAEKREAAE